ncbi:tyrosine-protein kinase SYK-like [Mytilus galloprovincialis]|uniref:tyrosine-protein kinase SYK-like n=1 Tax=Mytilus galloprovincialis TaxID=29158 RepID=UPI003F7C1B22
MDNSQEERIYENLPCTNDSQLGLEEIISMNDKYMIRESQLGLEEIVSSNDQYMIRESQLELEEMIGQGQFTTVHKGFCTLREEGRVSVVVKKFRNGNVVEEDEFLEEAETMRNLSHQRIVHVIGICRANRIMIVLEFCPCGPLNSYLANHKKLKQSTVLQLMWQVAQGMSYISYKNYIHGQLSARNVFLLSETSAKIGGFKLLSLNREDIYKLRII